MPLILALDQGTTSSRALVVALPEQDQPLRILGTGQVELPQHYPGDGLVEHDANDIWQHTEQALQMALQQAGIGPQDVAALGITNQRETAVLWDRATGTPLHNAIVWQDRRTAALCEQLRRDGREETLQRRTGLLADPYFSATKLRWLLDHVPDGQARAERGELAFGTVDSWLIWNLTGGQVHATDATNASRTLLFNIHTQQWDPVLLDLFNIPRALLPEVKNSADDYGYTLSGIPIRGVAGDQQAATVGQACLQPGQIKSTYGTGCFMLLNTGDTAVPSNHRLLTTVALRLNDQPTYALEGSIFVAGAAVQWLRDGLNAIQASQQVEQLATSVPDSGGVVMVPAFTGLGAPYWDPKARGALLGLTRDSTLAHIARATLEAMGYQTRDLIEAMQADVESANAPLPATLKVDGGMTGNDLLMQLLADICERPVERPVQTETTALGAVWLAALGVGAIPSLAVIEQSWQRERRFVPDLSRQMSERYFKLWKPAIARIRTDGYPQG